MGAADEETRRLAKIIDHPLRSRIIELLGERGPLGWKELSTELGVRTGALYYHLDTLEGLVERDRLKKYNLTKQGRIVFARTSGSRTIEAVHQAAQDLNQQGSARRALISVFVPRTLLSSLSRSPFSAASALLLVGLALGAMAFGLRLSPTLYYVSPAPGPVPALGGFVVSLAALWLICIACGRLAFKSTVDPFSAAAASALSFVPIFGFSAVVLIPDATSVLSSSTAVYTLYLVFFQAWSSAILGAGLSVASGIRIERSLLLSLAVLYATMVIMLVQGKGL